MASFTYYILLAASLLVAISNAAPQKIKLGITIPDECKGKGFCSIRPEGYDDIEAKINSLLPVHLIDIGSRSGNGPYEEPPEDDDNCPAESRLESNYIYDDPKGTKMDIIVQTKLFSQQIHKVTCKYDEAHYKSIKEGSSQCFTKLGLSDYNIMSTCQESYGTRRLMVYDPEENKLKMNNYTIPVCCSCVHRKKFP